MDRRTLSQCRILLTGASSGIGRALAQELARRGSRLLLVARRREMLEVLAAELAAVADTEPSGRPVIVQAGDVTDPAVRQAAIDAAKQTWGGLDMLINCAGVSAHGRFATSSEEILRQIMELNFFAAAELTRLALPLLGAGRDPLVVNIGSVLGHRGVPHNSEYSASKFALRGWSESLRTELHSQGIGVLLVSPGMTETEFFEHLLEKQAPTPWGKQQGITPEAVAAQVVRAIERRRREIFPNWRGRLLVWASCCCPALVDRLLRRYG